MFNEVDSTNDEAYNTGQKRNRKRVTKIPRDEAVKIHKKAPVRKKTSIPKRSVIKK